MVLPVYSFSHLYQLHKFVQAAKTRRSSNAQLADAEDMKGASQLKDTNFLNDEKGYKLSGNFLDIPEFLLNFHLNQKGVYSSFLLFHVQ